MGRAPAHWAAWSRGHPARRRGRLVRPAAGLLAPFLQNPAAAPRHSRARAVRAWEGGPRALWKAAGWSRLLQRQALSLSQEPLWLKPQAESGRSPQAQTPAGDRLESAWRLLPGGGEAPERQLTSAFSPAEAHAGCECPEQDAMPV